MTKRSDIEEAAKHTKNAHDASKLLLNHLGISRVVVVDDRFATGDQLSLEELIALCKKYGEDIYNKGADLSFIQFVPDEDIWSVYISESWNKVSYESKGILKALISELTQISPSNVEAIQRIKDAKTLEALKAIFDGTDLTKLSLQGWNRTCEDLIKDTKVKKTLFLFDLDLSKEEGGTSNHGLSLVRSVLKSTTSSQALCGILSHSTTKAEEYKKWLEIADGNEDINKNRFLFFSKDRLTREKDYIGFVNMIKLLILNPLCTSVKKCAHVILSNSASKAAKEIEKLDVYDFERMIFHVSVKEGVWEMETLIRIFTLYLAKILNEDIKTDRDLQSSIESVRSISQLITERIEYQTTASKDITRMEVYQELEYINKHHLPTDLGDIYKIYEEDNKPQYYILVMQPCDLKVRGETGLRHKAIREALLMQVTSEKEGSSDAYFDLPLFMPNSEEPWYVNFRARHSLPLSILDLCVYQTTGEAFFNSTESSSSNIIIPSWKKYYSVLYEEYSNAVHYYTEMSAKFEQLSLTEHHNDILKYIIPGNERNGILRGKVDISSLSLEYNCTRIKRLSHLHASAVLQNFSSYFARPAFPPSLEIVKG